MMNGKANISDENVPASDAKVAARDTTDLWHKRFGHLNVKNLCDMQTKTWSKA